MKGKKKFISVIPVLGMLILMIGSPVSAGTYTVTVTMGGSFSAPAVTVTNSAGGSITGNAYRLTSSVLNVTSITGLIRMNTLASGTSINMTVFYSTNGTNFYAGTTVNCPLNEQVQYTINFGASTKTIVALFFMPNTATWPSYNYSVWTPSFTRLLTDTTAPTISLSASTVYATTNIVTATITDSQSGVSVRKWASGIQTAGYFVSGGTVLTGSSFTVSANGYYTVYAIDVAGNSAVQTVFVSHVDNFISITHPLTIDYSITPDSGTPFMSPDITIVNNSRIKVYVSITSLEVITGGSIVFTDVPVNFFSNWSAISKLQSKQYIALGIRIKETAVAPDSWSNIYTTSTYYNRDVLCMLESFKENAAPEIKYELAITAADMRSGNYESALTRLEARVGSPMLSDVTRGLIGILRGDETQMYWISLSLKLADAQRQMLKQQALKVPGKIKRLSMVLLFCFIATYVVVLGVQIMSSLNAMFG